MVSQKAGSKIVKQNAYEWFLRKSIDEALQNAPQDADLQSNRALAVEDDVARLWEDQGTRQDILKMYARQKPAENKAELTKLREQYGVRSR